MNSPMSNDKYGISVIIPIYNVARFIERCVHSLMKQSLDRIEYIFVNDCTQDNSIEILKRVLECYPARKNHVKLIEHKTNKGLAAARLSGLKYATGDYIIHCDSDDWVEFDMYEKMYNLAISDGADIVVCDVIHEYDNYECIEKLNPKMSPRDVINKLNIRYGWYLWNKLVKRGLIFDNNIFPIIGINMWEDLVVTNRLFYYSEKVSYLDVPLYHYNRHNDTSIVNSQKLLSKREQQYVVVESLKTFFEKEGFDFSEGYLSYRLTIKDKFLELDPPDFKSWRKFYPEISKLVLKDKSYSLSYRLSYYLAQRGMVMPFLLLSKLSKLRRKSN